MASRIVFSSLILHQIHMMKKSFIYVRGQRKPNPRDFEKGLEIGGKKGRLISAKMIENA